MSFGYDDTDRRGFGDPPRAGGGERSRNGRGTYNNDTRQDELRYRMMEANRRMEDSSFECVRVLNETMSMATDTTEELERQGESLDRTERRLDEMEVDLEASKRNMREVKSVFGSMVNRFSKPKVSKDPPPSKSRGSSDHAYKKAMKRNSKQDDKPKPSMGNEVVDRNLDALELGLKQLEGQAFLIGHQLDESSDQIDRIKVKVDRNDVKMKGITKDAKRQL